MEPLKETRGNFTPPFLVCPLFCTFFFPLSVVSRWLLWNRFVRYGFILSCKRSERCYKIRFDALNRRLFSSESWQHPNCLQKTKQKKKKRWSQFKKKRKEKIHSTWAENSAIPIFFPVSFLKSVNQLFFGCNKSFKISVDFIVQCVWLLEHENLFLTMLQHKENSNT